MYLDNLKVVLIAAIIALHAVLGYAGTVEAWTYTAVREVTLTPAVEITLIVLVGPFGFLLMALLFLVAGLLTPPSYDRKGGRRFVADRLMRLGIPFLAYVLVVQPTLVYLVAHPLGVAPGSFWDEYLGPERRLDTGPLWFVGVLLVYSLVYAAWRRWRSRAGARRAGPDREPRAVTVHLLVAVAMLVAGSSFLVRLVYPYGSESGFTDLNLWEWPACIALFTLGVHGSRLGWLDTVPGPLARACRTSTLAASAGMAALLVLAGATDRADDALGGWHVLAAAFVALEAVLTVFGSVWLLGVTQRRLAGPHRWGPALSRSAYGAFMLQAVFLLGLAVALRPVPVPAEVKAVLVAGGAVVGSFGAAWLLIRRVPGIGRIL